MSTCCLIPLL
uniref:Uncharacterized protein n=1 Tax=Arundo donax TaxID=35708 RepID=A0A0A9F778_ARUDO